MTTGETNFDGLRVAAFESRRAEEMRNLIARLGGVPFVSPSMREVAPTTNPEAVDFAHRVITGQVDVIIWMTGVGVRHLVAQVERHVPRERFLAAVSDVTTIARGPKPVAVLKEMGLVPSHRVPEPNTWREVLALVDRLVPIADQTIGLQEYGEPNASLVAGLEARGATVINLKVYDWDLPEDTAPLEQNARALAAGERDVALFTSSHQVVNLLRVAAQLELTGALREALRRTVVCSIGPTTSETLRQHELPIDLEPEHSRMGTLVAESARRSRELLTRKRWLTEALPAIVAAPESTERTPFDESLMMRAFRREPVERTPIWLMRQAGRYLPEYRAVRQKVSFLELCKNPELCAQVMIETVNRLGVDAAIIFADLLPILEPMGMDLEFAQGEGPIIHNPVRQAGDVDRVLELESVDALHFVMETVRLTRTGLPSTIPVLGFAGAPFTLASYAIEGGGSRTFLHTKTLMYRDPTAWDVLMSRLSRAITRYLNAQITAGAQAVQIFDSWVGCLGPDDYRRYVLPHSRSVIAGVQPGVPVIHFATGNPGLLPLLAEAGGAVIGIDWRIALADAWRAVGYGKAVQGNLDPLVLFADRADIRARAKQILDQAAGRPGHIFNLGHGVLPQTPVDNVLALVEAVKELSARA